jgi:U4/U6 small nuclear ribonucleoprotein PRP31
MSSDLFRDLDDLGSDEDEQITIVSDETFASHKNTLSNQSTSNPSNLDEEMGDESSDEEIGNDTQTTGANIPSELPRDMELDHQISTLSSSKTRIGYRVVAKLRETKKFNELIEKVSKILSEKEHLSLDALKKITSIESWDEYSNIVSSNSMMIVIENEIDALYNYVSSIYSRRFPELKTILPHPIDYIKAILTIKNETDLSLVDFESLGLASTTVMVLTLTGTKSSLDSSSSNISAAEMDDVLSACKEILELQESKHLLLKYIESRMAYLAPNVSAILSPRVSALLVGIVGGIVELSRIPGCNISLVGQKKKQSVSNVASLGLSRISTVPHSGVVLEAPVVSSAPQHLHRKLVKLIGSKVALASRVDAARQSLDGAIGALYLKEIQTKIAKWLEPPPGRQKRALPAPDVSTSKKRGGKRARKLKELLGVSDARKEANRMIFASATTSMDKTSNLDYGDVVMGKDQGMLNSGVNVSGRLRLEKKEMKMYNKNAVRKPVNVLGSSGATSGLSSSLAFTPIQGIELVNPNAMAEKLKRANEDLKGYFSSKTAQPSK